VRTGAASREHLFIAAGFVIMHAHHPADELGSAVIRHDHTMPPATVIIMLGAGAKSFGWFG
jgi:hypothetical protein